MSADIKELLLYNKLSLFLPAISTHPNSPLTKYLRSQCGTTNSLRHVQTYVFLSACCSTHRSFQKPTENKNHTCLCCHKRHWGSQLQHVQWILLTKSPVMSPSFIHTLLHLWPLTPCLNSGEDLLKPSGEQQPLSLVTAWTLWIHPHHKRRDGLLVQLPPVWHLM